MQKPLFVVISLFLMLGSSLQKVQLELILEVKGKQKNINFSKVIDGDKTEKDIKKVSEDTLIAFKPDIATCFPNFKNLNDLSDFKISSEVDSDKTLVLAHHKYLNPPVVFVSCIDGKEVFLPSEINASQQKIIL